MGRILCVAEKPSIAKTVAQHLGGVVRTENIRDNQFIKNYRFDYNFGQRWGHCHVTFTSVIGHLISHDFSSAYRKWESCNPSVLFDAPIEPSVPDVRLEPSAATEDIDSVQDKKPIAMNIETQAQYSDILYIWTDCDREGENIGAEIRDIALKKNPRLEVKRARFSNVERNHIIQAAHNPAVLDQRQSDAVDARIEIDLRTGSAITRQLTLNLRGMVPALVEERKVLSYGSCQFPTLGFVVERYFRVKNFVPEPFWSIKVIHKKEDTRVTFNWKRVHLFDRMAVVILYERCINAKVAKVVKMQKRSTSKWRPLPLTTVELQKMGSRYLRMDSSRVMKVAEDLYTKGWISYPRTETDQFDHGMDLRSLIQKQTQGTSWGHFAQR